jgi:hypothetical protein
MVVGDAVPTAPWTSPTPPIGALAKVRMTAPPAATATINAAAVPSRRR